MARSESDSATSSPLRWVPSAWVGMGFAYAVVTNVSAVLLRDIGLNTALAIGWASALGIAYVVKPLYAPIVELNRTKRFFVLSAQLSLGFCFLAMAASVYGSPSIVAVLLLLAIIALVGSVQDIASEGLYLTELNRRQQAALSGLQSIFWNGAALVGGGGLIALSNAGMGSSQKNGRAWAPALALSGVWFLVLALWHSRSMPEGTHIEWHPKDDMRSAGSALFSFHRRAYFWRSLAVCLAFPISTGLIERVELFFMIDPITAGGLALPRELAASLYTTAGLSGLVVGAAAGSLTIARQGLGKSMMLMGVTAITPAGIFLILAAATPVGLPAIGVAVFLARALLAFGMVGYVVYLQRALSPGQFPTTHYNLASGLKGLTMMLMGMISGALLPVMGYTSLFAVALFCGIPMLALCRHGPIDAATGH